MIIKIMTQQILVERRIKGLAGQGFFQIKKALTLNFLILIQYSKQLKDPESFSELFKESVWRVEVFMLNTNSNFIYTKK